MSENNLSILIVSCDKYADLWSPFFSFFEKYWPDCPFPVYLGSNHKVLDHPRVKMLLSGDDPSWAESARRIVDRIHTPYFLMLLEDFFLTRKVDTDLICYLAKSLEELNGAYMRLRPRTPPDIRLENYPLFGEIKRNAPYRVALQAALWRKDVFLDLLHDGETAWDMEISGSKRSNDLEMGFYSTWGDALEYYPTVTFGKWIRNTPSFCRQHGIECDLAYRPVMTLREHLGLEARRLRMKLIYSIPWETRRRIKEQLLKTNLGRRLT